MLTANHDAALHIIPNPAGTFHFVGKVPPQLAFIYESEEDVATALHCGPGIARRIAEKNGRTFASRTFPTAEAAAQALAEYNAAKGLA
jgi:hypothetical protein